MRKYYGYEKTQFLTGLHIFSLPEYEVVFVCLSVCMDLCAVLMPQWLNRFYSCSVFESLSIIGQCLVNMSILSLRIEALQMGPKKQNHDFTKNGSKVNVCNYRDFSK
jgi:hypothetical protein